MDLSLVLRHSLAILCSLFSCGPLPTRVPTPTAAARAVPAAEVSQDDQEPFRWHARLEDGRTLEVRNVNGAVEALPASGDEAEVVATKNGSREALAHLAVLVREDGTKVSFCVADRREGEAQDCGSSHRRGLEGDARVDFALRVPRGVRLVASTCNGNVTADSLTQPVVLASVNGSLRAIGVVPTQAATVNGSIAVSLPTHWTEDVELKTVNGNIDLSLPDGTDADLEASAVHGDVVVRLPVTRLDGSRDMHVVLGRGGRALRARTVNGTIRLGRST